MSGELLSLPIRTGDEFTTEFQPDGIITKPVTFENGISKRVHGESTLKRPTKSGSKVKSTVSKDNAQQLRNGFHDYSKPHSTITKNQLTNSKGQSFTSVYDLERFEQTPFYLAMFSYISYLVLNLVGRFRDFIRCLGLEKHHMAREPERTRHFVPLYQDYEAFFTRNLYRRIRDCWNRPISSAPGAEFDLMDRWSPDHGWNFEYPGTVTRCLNFGSYNYLGFADPYSPAGCSFGSSQEKRTNINENTIRNYGVSVGYCPSQEAVGGLSVQRDLENLLAEFTGQEAAITFPMGFATNALNIPTLVDKYCCIISDELNHTSLILGMRLSGAHVRRFRHNNMESLEKELRNAVLYGHPRYRRAYRKILIVVEGIYSMEGSIVRLPEIIALKQRYKAYLYLDEAHSIGALGPRGGGVCDYYGIDPRQVDVAMGTFTKSFGSAGGYIAGKKTLIDWLRVQSHSTVYGASMSAVVCQQIINVLQLLMDPSPAQEGQKTIQKLAWNTRYFRNALYRMGFIVYGHADSPVVPIIVYLPGKIPAISRACRERGVGIVVVGYPATPLLLCRARFCISAAHTKEMLDKALSVLDEVADMFRLRYSRMPLPAWVPESASAFGQDHASPVN